MTKILVIEDDPMLRDIYTNVLTKENYQVEAASDGLEGLKLAEANEPALIILDMLMPNLDGIGFLKQYDVVNKHPDVKVIVFSNMAIQAKVDEAISLGAVNYKAKAFFTPKEMVGLVRETLAIQ